jgi:hypothetical protein
VEEFLSICHVFGLTGDIFEKPRDEINLELDPYEYVNLPITKEVANDICQRSVLVKTIIDPLGYGKTFEECRDNTDVERLNAYTSTDKKWKF